MKEIKAEEQYFLCNSCTQEWKARLRYKSMFHVKITPSAGSDVEVCGWCKDDEPRWILEAK